MYDIIDTVTTINGKTGAISAADLNAILTAAGYKLTDENTVTSINGKTGAIAASDIALVLTSAGYKLTDTTYSDATTSTAGLMTAADKTKLNGITAGAQPHIAPTIAEVKSALGTGEGTTKYLREDGTWQPIDGEYQDLTAGNVVGTFSDESEISFRPTAGAVDIESGKADKGAKLMAVKGNTVKWNQLAKNGNFVNSDGWLFDGAGGTIANNEATVTSSGSVAGAYRYDISIISGHYYFISCYAKLSQITAIRLYFSTNVDNGVTITPSNANNYIALVGVVQMSINTNLLQCNATLSSGETITIKNIIAIDLTLIYGEGNEPTTPEQFEADYQRWFGKPLTYEEYDAGSLRPVKMTGIKTTGFNAWDEEWEKGYYSTISGIKVPSDLTLRSKNKIAVLPNSIYHIKQPLSSTEYVIICFYYNNTFLSALREKISSFTTPSNCNNVTISVEHYIDRHSSTYQNDICVNLSHSGARDGEYESYWSSMLNVPVTTLNGKLNGEGSSVVVFPDGLKKAGNIFDEIVRRGDKTYAIKRVGSVDLGTLDWSYNSNNECFLATNTNGNQVRPAYNDSTIRLSCGRYEGKDLGYVETSSYTAPGIALNTTSHWDNQCIYIKDTSYGSDAAALKTSLSGVPLYYELKTPEEYLLDDFELPQEYDVDDYGTEEVLLGTDGVAPVLDIKYGINAPDTIKNLPHSYVSAVGEQSFTEAQKARARKNIGLGDVDNIPT